MCVCVVSYVFPKSNDSPVVKSTVSAQILFSNINLQWKDPGILGEVVDSRTASGKIKAFLEHLVMTENSEMLKRDGSGQKGIWTNGKEHPRVKGGTIGGAK